MKKINLLALLTVLVGRAYASSFNYMGSFSNHNNVITADTQNNSSILLNEEEEEEAMEAIIEEEDGVFSFEQYSDNIAVITIVFNGLRSSDLIRNMFLNNNLHRDEAIDVNNLPNSNQYRHRITLHESMDENSGRTRFEFLLVRGINTGIEYRNYHCLGALANCLEFNGKSDLLKKLIERDFYRP